MRGRRPPRDRGVGELSGTPTYGALSSSQQTVTLSRVRSSRPSRSTPPPPPSAGSDTYAEHTPRRSSVLRGAVRPSVDAPSAASPDAYSNASSPVSSRGTSRSASRGTSVAPGAVAASSDAFRLSFNELPNLAQYLILNELIRTNSDASTSVLLTALPAPEPGTSTSHEQSTTYLQQLQRLYGGGPPVMGVHATTLTMTMSL